MKYRIGLDIGIGSVGWSVISGDRQNARIEDFGVRIFDSGEKNKGKDRKSQERRGFRGTRRLIRRRRHRKDLIKKHLEYIGFLDKTFYDELESIQDNDVFEMKVRGLDEKLSPAEFYKCLIHFCNHRGYKDFYENENYEEESENGINKAAASRFSEAFANSKYRTVSEFLYNEKSNGNAIAYRNRDSRKADDFSLINRKLLMDELNTIIKKQQEYYNCLRGENGSALSQIVFSQRIFEEGPGNPEDEFRRYTGFLELLGQCPFYSEEKRGFRCTVIADLFAVVNTLSQYRYVDAETGEIGFDPVIAEHLLAKLLYEGNLTMTGVKKVVKSLGYNLLKSENSDDKALSKALKFIKPVKMAIETAGGKWEDYYGENHLDIDNKSTLNQIGEVLSKYQTPSKREVELKKIDGLTDEIRKELSGRKFSGTAGASYKYMVDAIEAFRNGEIYGNFQARANNEIVTDSDKKKTYKLSAQQVDDPDVKNNPVVFRSINETRKILNSIIETYGSPEYIAVEVASDLNRSYDSRRRVMKMQREREAENDKMKKQIAELIGIDESEVQGMQIERFKLYELQDGKSLYSGKPLGDVIDVIKNANYVYEVDHIIPYSLILDNTINNKALIYSSENQQKGQQAPLMYLKGDDREDYVARVNELYQRKKGAISDIKYKYLMMPSLYGSDAEETLSGWKSRNINDTRYITKYIIALLEKNLIFEGDEKKRSVFGVKGAFTSRFRKIWLNNTEWGDDDKRRDSYLNHAIDAVVVANLTPAYLEIASDNIKLQQIRKQNKKRSNAAFDDYIERCCKKMKKYYGFDEEYTRQLLSNSKQVPAYLPKIKEEVEARFIDNDEELFKEKVVALYGENANFKVKPQMPIVSCKAERKYRGTIADSNPIKIVVREGKAYKIKRKKISDLTKKEYSNGMLYTLDKDLLDTLGRIFSGTSDDKYTIGKYLEENKLNKFVTDLGQSIFKVSVNEGEVSNYYKKDISEGNYTYLGMLKYYCVEVYRNTKGKLCTRGVRYVDVIKTGRKLYMKAESIPEDYKEHVMYLFKNDYILVRSKNGAIKFEGYYQSVKTIQRSEFYFNKLNDTKPIVKGIGKNDSVEKIDISIMGKRGGVIKCSEPLSLIVEKK